MARLAPPHLPPPRRPEQPASGRQSLAMAPAAQPSGMALRRPGLPASAPQIHVTGRVAPPFGPQVHLLGCVPMAMRRRAGVSDPPGGSPFPHQRPAGGSRQLHRHRRPAGLTHCRCHRESQWRVPGWLSRSSCRPADRGPRPATSWYQRQEGLPCPKTGIWPQSAVWRVIRIPPFQAVHRGPKVPATRPS